MPNAEMKTLTIGDTTYEIVDEEAREKEGDLSELNTQVQTDLVAAINEVAESSGVVSVNGMTGTVVLTAADVGAATTGAITDEATARTAADAQLQGQITALGNGAPIPVSTIAAMTVQTQVYLYTGTETGESTGYWYTYDSTQEKFVPRGEYGGAVTDTTLSISGAAADAKTVGDVLAGKADADDVTAIDDSIGDLSQLTTTAKDNLVSATTELKNDINEITADLLSVCDYTASVNLFNASAELDSSYHSVDYNILKNVITLDGTVSSGGTKKFTFGTDLDNLGLSIGDYVTMSYKIVKGTTNKNLSFSLNSVAGTYVYVNTSASPATSVTFQFTAEMTTLGIYFGNGAVIDDLEIELQIEAGQTPTAIMAKGEEIITGAKDTVARDAISQLPDYNTLPDYWETYLKARIPEINAYSVPSIGKWDRFVFITDIHLQYQNRTYKSAGHSNKILARLMNECNLGMIVFGGDALTSDYQSQQDTIDALSEFRKYYSNVWEYIYCVDGNHDTGGNNKDTTTIGDWTTLNHSVVFEMLAQDKLKQYESVGSGGGSYYFDNKACKIRYIFLWHNYANNYQDMTWLTNVLNATESGWTIVVFTHYSLSDANTIDSKLSATNRVIDTLNAYDGSATIAGVIGGHAHTISSAVYTAKGYPVICSNSDLYNVGDASRTKGNITEHSMEVVQIDTEAKKITLLGVGFSDTGTEREYTYA